jgi:hypothetical protein
MSGKNKAFRKSSFLNALFDSPSAARFDENDCLLLTAHRSLLVLGYGRALM